MAMRFPFIAGLLLAIPLVAPSQGQTVQGQTVDEYQVKAAFIYNFAKFVQWPPEAFKAANNPIQVCLLGPDPFGGELQKVIRGKSIDGRSLDVRQVSEPQDISNCQILFVSSSETKRFHSLCGKLSPEGILTIGEAPGFASNGGIINFKLDGGHVRFEINIGAAEHAELHISSKLLSLADIVKPEKPR